MSHQYPLCHENPESRRRGGASASIAGVTLSLPSPLAARGEDDATGTPLSPTAVKVMLLGSGELAGSAIELQRWQRGIAVDRTRRAAMQVAHRSHVIAMTDARILRALSRPSGRT